MGVWVYWIIVALIVVLGLILPQEGKDKKYYIITMTIIHSFFAGWHYKYLTGDLRKYAAAYYNYIENGWGWFHKEVFRDGRNTGFQWISKAIAMLTNGDFQIYLIIFAVFMQIAVAILIYRYSPKPWLSYLIWDCMSFYITYSISAIKQGLAMAVLMYAMIAVFEKKKVIFLFFVLLAGFIHAPAFVFLPAYFIANTKITDRSILMYIAFTILVFVFKQPIATLAKDLYYEEGVVNTNQEITLGGRFIVILLIILCGLLLKGFRELWFEQLFNLMVIAATIQIFSGYNNVFTRFADYYLQFTILFIPMIFYKQTQNVPIKKDAEIPRFLFDVDSMKFFVIVLTGIMVWWYHVTCLGLTIEKKADDYLNYRFCWEVKDDSYEVIEQMEKEEETEEEYDF